MSAKPLLLAIVLLGLTFALPGRVRADGVVTASGAGDLPGTAEDLTGMNVTEIVGAIPDIAGVDMFKISITDYLDFSAMTVGPGAFGIPDTELFLFDASGFGVMGNDDIDGGNTLSCLPAAGVNPCESPLPLGVGPTSDGTYYLAVTPSANSPLDALNNDIFTFNQSTDVVGPNSGVGAVTGWDGGIYTQPDFDLPGFDIKLTGTSPMTVPEPGTLGLLAAGLLFFLARGKRSAAPSEPHS